MRDHLGIWDEMAGRTAPPSTSSTPAKRQGVLPLPIGPVALGGRRNDDKEHLEMTVNSYGTDVSDWNRPPLPGKFNAYVFAKASEGKRFAAPSYKTWRRIARAMGRTFGAYHFARPDNGNNPVDEARFFLQTAKLGPGDVVILDIERDAPNLEHWVETFCVFVNRHAQCEIIIYTNRAIGSRLAESGHRPLWIADPSSPEGRPVVPYPFQRWLIHQFGQRDGFDLNVTNGVSAIGLRQFAVRTVNAHKAPEVKAAPTPRQAAIAARNALARLFWVLRIPWGATS